jgi:hypothetical protein
MSETRVVVTGGTGLVGSRLIQALLTEGTKVTLVTRHPDHALFPLGVEPRPWDDLAQVVDGADGVFNFAGESIAGKRWTPERKKVLRQSRIQTTERLAEALRWARHKPRYWVNASAVGVYGGVDGRPIDEASPTGKGFLADLCRAWEAAANPAVAHDIRVVTARLGVVLAPEGGALPKMMLPMKLFQGASLGHGQQGMSWIHIEDLIALLLRARSEWEGPLNATAPFPVSNDHFTRELGRAMHRPVLPIPAFLTRTALRLLVGEMADEMLLQGAFVYPKKAQAQGFEFRFPNLREALADLLPEGN